MEFLVEVCDPCEAPGLGYTVNGVRVSDFYTSPLLRAAGQSRRRRRPTISWATSRSRLEVLQGGYLSWREPDGTWFQEKFFGTKPVFVKLGQFDKSFGALRPWIDSLTLQDRLKLLKQRAVFPSQVLVKLPREDDNDLATEASCRRAARLREQIKRVAHQGETTRKVTRPRSREQDHDHQRQRRSRSPQGARGCHPTRQGPAEGQPRGAGRYPAAEADRATRPTRGEPNYVDFIDRKMRQKE